MDSSAVSKPEALVRAEGLTTTKEAERVLAAVKEYLDRAKGDEPSEVILAAVAERNNVGHFQVIWALVGALSEETP